MVINVATEEVTALAILSVARSTDLPVLVIDCGATDRSRRVLGRLRREAAFEVVEAPVRTHGETLDLLFQALPDEMTLLVDSDAEIRDAGLVGRLVRVLDQPSVFGAGWTEGGYWMREAEFGGKFAVYHERMWLPLVLLRTSHVREALDADQSFVRTLILNDVRWSPRLSALLARRFDHPHIAPFGPLRRLPPSWNARLQHNKLDLLRWARSDWYGLRPNYVFADTGSQIYAWNKRVKRRHFVGCDMTLMEGEVKHYGGVTRASLRNNRMATRMEHITGEVTDRLMSAYGVNWADLVG